MGSMQVHNLFNAFNSVVVPVQIPLPQLDTKELLQLLLLLFILFLFKMLEEILKVVQLLFEPDVQLLQLLQSHVGVEVTLFLDAVRVPVFAHALLR